MDNQRLLTEILKYERGKIENRTDIVVKETSLTLIVNDIKLTTLACLDEKLMNLGIGFLFSEGLLSDILSIKEIELCDKRSRLKVSIDLPDSELKEYLQSVELTTGCGGGISRQEVYTGQKEFSKKKVIELSSIPSLMFDFQKLSILFKQTGGVHSAALGYLESIDYFAEDIGRHNAVDKVLGAALMQESNLENYYLLISGRISSEIVRKAIRLNIPLILSQAAPTSKAISSGWQQGIYLIGFARGNRFNIYTGLNEISQFLNF